MGMKTFNEIEVVQSVEAAESTDSTESPPCKRRRVPRRLRMGRVGRVSAVPTSIAEDHEESGDEAGEPHEHMFTPWQIKRLRALKHFWDTNDTLAVTVHLLFVGVVVWYLWSSYAQIAKETFG